MHLQPDLLVLLLEPVNLGLQALVLLLGKKHIVKLSIFLNCVKTWVVLSKTGPFLSHLSLLLGIIKQAINNSNFFNQHAAIDVSSSNTQSFRC